MFLYFCISLFHSFCISVFPHLKAFCSTALGVEHCTCSFALGNVFLYFCILVFQYFRSSVFPNLKACCSMALGVEHCTCSFAFGNVSAAFNGAICAHPTQRLYCFRPKFSTRNKQIFGPIFHIFMHSSDLHLRLVLMLHYKMVFSVFQCSAVIVGWRTICKCKRLAWIPAVRGWTSIL